MRSSRITSTGSMSLGPCRGASACRWVRVEGVRQTLDALGAGESHGALEQGAMPM